MEGEGFLVVLLANDDKLFEFRGDALLAENALREGGITPKPHIRFVSEAEHIHHSKDEFDEQLARLIPATAAEVDT